MSGIEKSCHSMQQLILMPLKETRIACADSSLLSKVWIAHAFSVEH